MWVRIVFIFLILFFWISNAREVSALTVNKTFSFLNSAENFVFNSGVKTVVSFNSTYGNPAGSIKVLNTNRNNSEIISGVWTGTWEDLGVPAGAQVMSIGLSGAYNRVVDWTAVTSCTIGPYTLRDNSNINQATLWAGRTVSGADTSWQTVNAQTIQAVPSPISASNSLIKLYWEGQIMMGNNRSAILSFYQDEITFTIEYNLPVSISLTTDGNLAFGTIGLGASIDSTSGGINDVQTVRVDSGPAKLDIRSSNFTSGANTWVLGSINGLNTVKWEYSKDTSTWNTFSLADTLYPLEASLAQSSITNLFFRLAMPSNTAVFNEYSSTITVVASAP